MCAYGQGVAAIFNHISHSILIKILIFQSFVKAQMKCASITENFIYNEVPNGDEWRISFVDELIQLRSGNLEVVMPNGEYFTRKEINNFIIMVSSQAADISSFDTFIFS